MRVTVLKEIPEDPDLSEAWNTLVLAMDNPEVFFTYQWALAAGRGFREHLTPLLFLMHDSDQLVGVVALAIDPKAPRAAFFLTSSTADYCDIVSTPANRKTVLLALLEEIRKQPVRHTRSVSSYWGSSMQAFPVLTSMSILIPPRILRFRNVFE